MAAKGIVKGIITAAVICGLAAGGWGLYQHFGGKAAGSTEKVFVQKVATLNTVDGANLFAHNFSGVIVSQKSVDVKYDTQKTIGEILVKDGDSVKKGDKLLTYDVEQIQINIDSAKLEIERMQNEIETYKNEIEQFERERQTATGDAALTCTQNILQRKSQIAKTEYDIKAKNIDLTKLEGSLDNAFVTAPIDGTVKDLKEPGSSDQGSDMMYDYGYGYGGGGSSSGDVIMKITAAGDYRVKGTFNEQNSAQIYPGAGVFLRSRIDPDVVIRGTVSEIDTNPQSDSQSGMYYGGMSDEQSTSSKYSFYVEPESLEGFMLGQHILIETDNGQMDSDKKEGIWLYSSFVQWDGDRNFVWAKNGREQIEKRYVEVGQINDESGDCEILSGLTIDDYIAFPADYIEEGMSTTTNKSDKNIPENVMTGEDPNGSMDFTQGGGEIPEDMEQYFRSDSGDIPVDAEMFDPSLMPDMGDAFKIEGDGNAAGAEDGNVADAPAADAPAEEMPAEAPQQEAE